MKRILAALITVVLLCGCGKTDAELDRAMAMRERLLSSDGCSFDTVITADYGDKLYTFSMSCQTDSQGNMTFAVTQPESIAGITGQIAQDGGKLTFDGNALAFSLMADDQVSPVSAPWLLVHTLRSGYLTACGQEGDLLLLSIDDSYEEDALHLEIWLSSEDIPIRAEILFDGRRILSMEVNNFGYV